MILAAVTLLFSCMSTVLASTSISGTLYYRLYDNADGFGTQNDSRVDFFRIQIDTDKSFNDDKGYAYLALQCQSYLPEPDNPNEHEFNWNIRKYGYNYSLNDRWEAGVTYDTEGVTLSDGKLATDWEWLHISAFNSMNALKLLGSPFDTVKAGIYLEPVTKDYVIKSEYKNSGFKLGAGYTNISKTYNVYTEILPTEKSRIYLDYYGDENVVDLAKGKYLVEASAKFDPITLALTYSNEDRIVLGQTVFKLRTVDISVDYALAAKQSVTCGLVYNEYYSDIDALYTKYNIDKGYVGVRQESTLYQSLSDTHINGGYRFDGTNLLEADYNATTGAWWAAMAIYF